jgi:hypothetical protein
VESQESGPVTVPQTGGGLCNVATNRPLILALVLGSIIEEIRDEDVVVTSSLFLLSNMLALTQVHVTLEVGRNISPKATESFILLDFANWGAFEGTNRHDGAVVINCMNNEAQAVKLSQTTGRNVFGIKGARAEDSDRAEAHGINEHLLVFSTEVTLDLVEDRLAVRIGCCKFAKLKGLA